MTPAWSAPDPNAPAPAATPAAAPDGAVAAAEVALPAVDAPLPAALGEAAPFATRRADAVAHAYDTDYAGLATRAVAFAVDAVVINGIALIVAVVFGLALSLFDITSTAQHILVVIGAALTLLWTMAYFLVFWESTGQTPGNRLMEIRVQDARTGRTISYRRGLPRVIVLELSALLLFTPMLLMLVDERRRAPHDRLARSVVVYAPTADEQPRSRAGSSA